MIDADPNKEGRQSREGIVVHAWERLADIVRRNHVEIGIIAVPAESAQAVYDALAEPASTPSSTSPPSSYGCAPA